MCGVLWFWWVKEATGWDFTVHNTVLTILIYKEQDIMRQYVNPDINTHELAQQSMKNTLKNKSSAFKGIAFLIFVWH